VGLTALASFSLAAAAFADLGDTKAQSIQRYGEVSAQDGNWLKFHSGDLLIEEWLSPATHRVEAIVYTSPEGGFEIAQIEAFEKANIPAQSRNGKWVQNGDYKRAFVSWDRKYCTEAGHAEGFRSYFSISTARGEKEAE
jgi:hypothetical protein